MIRSRPTTACARITARSGRRPAPVRRSARTNSPAPTTWAPTFAIAEPVSPSPAGYTSSGQATADSPLATSTMTTGSRVRCTPRIQPLPASTSSTPGRPRTAMRNHDSAACCTSARRRRRAAGSAGRPAASPSTDDDARRCRAASHDACTPSPHARRRCGRRRTNGRRATSCRTRRRCRRWSARPSARPRRRARPGASSRGGRRPRCRRAGRAVRRPARRMPTRRAPATGGWPAAPGRGTVTGCRRRSAGHDGVDPADPPDPVDQHRGDLVPAVGEHAARPGGVASWCPSPRRAGSTESPLACSTAMAVTAPLRS